MKHHATINIRRPRDGREGSALYWHLRAATLEDAVSKAVASVTNLLNRECNADVAAEWNEVTIRIGRVASCHCEDSKHENCACWGEGTVKVVTEFGPFLVCADCYAAGHMGITPSEEGRA